MQDGAALSKLVEQEQLDVLCLQETKLQGQHCEDMVAAAGEHDLIPGQHVHGSAAFLFIVIAWFTRCFVQAPVS